MIIPRFIYLRRSLSAKFRVTRIAGMLAAIVLLCLPARAQDLRTVRQPSFPPAYKVLPARLSAVQDKTLRPGDENRPDTARIQRAMNECPKGHAVELKAGGAKNAFLSGPLNLPSGVTLRIGRGAILFASRNPRDYDLSPGSCGILSARGHGCKALINVNHADNAAVMGPGTIDGRGWAKIQGENSSWWELAQEAKVRHDDQNCPFLILATHADNFTLYRVMLKNSPMYHVFYRNGNGFTAWGVVIDTPKTARNTDGIDPTSSTNVTITHCFIHDGDDDVAVKAGNGGPASHITVADDHFYTGHGMSIGSETNGGVSDVRVTDLSIDGADNGLRIKSNSSKGGLVHNVVYRDVCIRDTKNPILMTTRYPFYGAKPDDKLPEFEDIILDDVHIVGPGRITLNGYDAQHRLGMTFNGVVLEDPSEIRIVASNARIKLGPAPVNFRPSGDDVTLAGHPREAKGQPCKESFPPLPKQP